MGTDSWSLKYDANSGEKVAGTITKTGSKQLKTATFTVNDARFAGRLTGNADFYLDSRNPANNALDGNEWVQAVEVEKLGPGSEDPTPTPTPTVSPTPQPTTGIVEGVLYHDANGSGSMDTGETLVQGAVMTLVEGAVEKYTVTSGADGKYRFDAVAPGQYKLKQKSAPGPYNVNPVYATGVTLMVSASNDPIKIDVGMTKNDVVLDNKLYLPMTLR